MCILRKLNTGIIKFPNISISDNRYIDKIIEYIINDIWIFGEYFNNFLFYIINISNWNIKATIIENQ